MNLAIFSQPTAIVWFSQEHWRFIINGSNQDLQLQNAGVHGTLPATCDHRVVRLRIICLYVQVIDALDLGVEELVRVELSRVLVQVESIIFVSSCKNR